MKTDKNNPGSELSSIIKRWKNKQNKSNFNKTFKSSTENEPRMKQYDCVKDETIKGILFSIKGEKITVDIYPLVNANGSIYSFGPNQSPPQLIGQHKYEEEEINLYYYSWNTGSVGVKRTAGFQEIKISTKECVLGTGRKLISNVKDMGLEEFFEALTTKGTGFIKKSCLCPAENYKLST